MLTQVGDSLDHATGATNRDVTSLEAELNRIASGYDDFMASFGPQLIPAIAEEFRARTVTSLVDTTRAAGDTVQGHVTGYEEKLGLAQGAMSDMGFIPPDLGPPAGQAESAEDEDSGLKNFGDVATIVSGAAGGLALIPALTPVAGPVAALAGAAALGAHGLDMMQNGAEGSDWYGLAGDAAAIVPAGRLAWDGAQAVANMSNLERGVQGAFDATTVGALTAGEVSDSQWADDAAGDATKGRLINDSRSVAEEAARLFPRR